MEHFFERAEVQIGFFIMTETGPKTILAGFFAEVKFKAGFLVFPHIGRSLIPSKIIVGKVMSHSSVAEVVYLGVPGLQLRSFQRLGVSGLELSLYFIL